MDAKDFAANLRKMMEKLVEEASSPEYMKQLGDEAASLIRKRTRLGYGVAEQGGNKGKLEPLTEPYVKQRKIKATGPTTPKKSNLTQKGDMLDALSSKPNGNGSIEIGFTDAHEAQKAVWTSKLRPFNNLSKAEISQLRKKLQDDLIIKLEKIKSSIK
jgi:hypothetical protein